MDLLAAVSEVLGKAADDFKPASPYDDVNALAYDAAAHPWDEVRTSIFHDALRDHGVEPDVMRHPKDWGWPKLHLAEGQENPLTTAYHAATQQYDIRREMEAHFPRHPIRWQGNRSDLDHQGMTERVMGQPHHWAHPDNHGHPLYLATIDHYDDAINRWIQHSDALGHIEPFRTRSFIYRAPGVSGDYGHDAYNLFSDEANQWYRGTFGTHEPPSENRVKILTRKAAPPDATSQMDNHGRILDYFGLAGHVQRNEGHPITWSGFENAHDPAHPHHEAYRAAVRQHQHEMEMQHFPSRIAEPPRTIEEPAPYQDIAPGAMWDWRYESHPRHQEWMDASLHHMNAQSAFGRSPEYAAFQDDPEFHGDDLEMIAASNREYARIANRWYQEQYGQPGSTAKMFAKAAPHLPVVSRMLIEDPSDVAAAAALHDTLQEEDIARPVRGVHPSQWSGFENAHLPDHPHHEAYDAAAMRHYHETGVTPSWEHPSRWPGFAAAEDGGMNAAHPDHPRHGEYTLAARDYHANWRQHMLEYFPHSPYDWQTSTYGGAPPDDPLHWSNPNHPDNGHFDEALGNYYNAGDAYARHLSPGAFDEGTHAGDWAREMARTRGWSRMHNRPDEANAWYRQHAAQGGGA